MASEWTGPAGVMQRAVLDAVAAAGAHDADEFSTCLAGLSRLDREQLSTLLGTVVQRLLERRHPDGLDSDDVDQLVELTVRSAAWYPRINHDSVVRVIVGALGVTEVDDEERQVDGITIIAHSLVLLADQLSGVPNGVRALLDHGLRELHRAQTQEMP